MSISVQIPGQAIGFTHVNSLPPIINNGGYIQDNNDDTSIDSRIQVQVANSITKSTRDYAWDYIPASEAPAYGDTSNYLCEVHLRYSFTRSEISPSGGGLWSVGVFINRVSDNLTLSTLGGFALRDDEPLNEPKWIKTTRDLGSGTVVPGGLYIALQTGSYPTYGPTRIGAGWGSTPGFFTGEVGAETIIRIHEIKVILQPGGWQVGEDLVGS